MRTINMPKRKIKSVEDNYEKNNTYKVLMKKYKDAYENGYYLECLLIDYALIEDRLRSFIYYIGGLNSKKSVNLDCEIFLEDTRKISKIIDKKIESDSLSINNISAKMEVIKSILKWVNESTESIDSTFLFELKRQCESLDIAEWRNVLKGIKEWTKFRDEVIHSILNKNIEDYNNQIVSKINEGNEYYKFISSQVKILKKDNKIREALKLR